MTSMGIIFIYPSHDIVQRFLHIELPHLRISTALLLHKECPN